MKIAAEKIDSINEGTEAWEGVKVTITDGDMQIGPLTLYFDGERDGVYICGVNGGGHTYDVSIENIRHNDQIEKIADKYYQGRLHTQHGLLADIARHAGFKVYDQIEETMTLRELVEKYGANGFVMIDAGSGSAGPKWVEWDEDVADEYGDTEMTVINADGKAYESGDKSETVTDIFNMVEVDAEDNVYTSEWIEDDKTDSPFVSSTPYMYRILF